MAGSADSCLVGVNRRAPRTTYGPPDQSFAVIKKKKARPGCHGGLTRIRLKVTETINYSHD